MSNPSEADLRRHNLRLQLAAILQGNGNLGRSDDGDEGPRGDSIGPPRNGSGLLHATSGSKSPQDGYLDALDDELSEGKGRFVPMAPNDFGGLHLAEAEVESLVLKFLLNCQAASGREVARQIGLSYGLCEQVLRDLKLSRLVVLKGAADLGDYVYELTEAGAERARKFAANCGYFGAAPICLEDYSASVAAQSLQNYQPTEHDLRTALGDLNLSEEVFERLGRAIISGRGLFLHGPPGNGKTSIAQRVTRAYGPAIWVPRAISAWGEIVRIFDPSCHDELPIPQGPGIIAEEKIDHRWVRIRRPTIIVGGELLLENLEITANRKTGISESPLQLKSNCGTLVIDDFGRQQVPPAALLNRWIVPLEKRYDFLNLTSGRKIQVPFDQFVVFSTNLEPRELVDEAFLRRIPYKIDICDPTEQQFRDLFAQLAMAMGIPPSRPPVDHLLQKYYRGPQRSMRFCHPRDLLRQVKVYYDFLEQPVRLTVEALDAAAEAYFSVL